MFLAPLTVGAGAANALMRTLARRAGIAWIVVAVTLLTSFVRADYPLASGRFLWAEDAYTFFNFARTGGLATIAQPYEGYLHVIPRIVAWSTNELPLLWQPLIFIGAWTIGLMTMLAVIAVRGRAVGIDPLTTAGVALLTTFQPTSDEMFFNLTNVQWLLGVALSVYLLTSRGGSKSVWSLIALAALCLTGPYCLILFPLVIVAHIARKPSKADWVGLGIFMACAAIQLFFLLTSERIAGKAEHIDPLLVGKAMIKLLLFVPHRLREWIPAIGFWLVYGWLLVRAVATRETRASVEFRMVALILAASLAFLAASLLSGAFPVTVVPDGPNRYTWIPYSLLIFTAAMLATRSRQARLTMAACLATVCYLKFSSIVRDDLHFPSFARLARIEPVAIPVNPLGDRIIWQMEVGTVSPSADVAEAAIGTSGDERFTSYVRVGADAFVRLSQEKVTCERAADIAIQLDGDHLNDGSITLSWSGPDNLAGSESMRRRYRPGPVRMQFAFPYPPGGVDLQSKELSDPAIVRLRRVEVFCLR